jgi:hypothetical protein
MSFVPQLPEEVDGRVGYTFFPSLDSFYLSTECVFNETLLGGILMTNCRALVGVGG